jgi:hypothetical protein
MTGPAPATRAAHAHLADHEIVDALEGRLAPPRSAHATSCTDCARQIEALRAIAGDAAAARKDVPEPPPFFWTQFSANLRAAVADEPLPGRRFAWMHGWTRPALAVAAVAVALAVMPLVTRMSRPGAPVESTPVSMTAPASESVDPVGDVFADIDQDEAWAVVRSLAEDLDHDEMDQEGVSARPGSAEHLTLSLSDPERVELMRLIEEQLKGRVEAAS